MWREILYKIKKEKSHNCNNKFCLWINTADREGRVHWYGWNTIRWEILPRIRWVHAGKSGEISFCLPCSQNEWNGYSWNNAVNRHNFYVTSFLSKQSLNSDVKIPKLWDSMQIIGESSCILINLTYSAILTLSLTNNIHNLWEFGKSVISDHFVLVEFWRDDELPGICRWQHSRRPVYWYNRQ